MDDIARVRRASCPTKSTSSQNTVSSYLRDTTQFAEYLHNRYGKGLREAEREHVRFELIWSGCWGGANRPRP